MSVTSYPGQLARRFNQISTALIDAEFRRVGLDMTPVQYSALGAIGEQPSIDQATLAVLISYDRTTIGGVVDRLVDKGFVSRQTNAQDRRAKVLTLTEQGEAALSVAHRAVANAQDQLVCGLDAQERDELKRLLEKAVLAATEQRQ